MAVALKVGALVWCIVGATVVGCVGPTPTPTASPTPTAVWIDVSAEQLAEDYASDVAEAKQRYEGKDLRVRGVVSSVTWPYPAPLTMLEGSAELGVACFGDSSVDPISSLVGRSVTMVGVGRAPTSVSFRPLGESATPALETLKYVELSHCLIVPEGESLPSARPSPNPTP